MGGGGLSLNQVTYPLEKILNFNLIAIDNSSSSSVDLVSGTRRVVSTVQRRYIDDNENNNKNDRFSAERYLRYCCSCVCVNAL